MTDSQACPSWNSTVIGIEGETALGNEIQLVFIDAPDRTFGLTVSAFEPTSTLVREDGNVMFRGVRTFTLTPAGVETDFTMAEVMTGSMLPMIARRLPDFGSSFTAFATDLKDEAENLK